MRNWTVNCVFGRSFDLRMSVKLPSKKPRLLQTETVGDPGSSVAVRPTIDIEEGKRPRRKVPMVPKARRNARPHSLIRWTSSTDANKMLARKIEYSAISLHSLVQVLWVHADDLPPNALFDFACQTDPSLSCGAQSFFAI